MSISEQDHTYIIWQNRAFDFYIAARACFHKGFLGPAAFLSQQCVEQLVKATLIWLDPSFEPKSVSHNLIKMSQMIREKVPSQNDFTVPEYICNYQSLPRYPDPFSRGYPVPSTLISEVDCLFADLVEMVAFQHNSYLIRTLMKKQNYNIYYIDLELNNEQLDRLRKHVLPLRSQPHA